MVSVSVCSLTGVTLLALLCVRGAESLKCNKCTGYPLGDDDKCWKFTGQFSGECLPGQNMCISELETGYPLESRDKVTRRCGQAKTAGCETRKSYEGISTTYCACSGENCNSAHLSQQSFAAVGITAALLVVFGRLLFKQ